MKGLQSAMLMMAILATGASCEQGWEVRGEIVVAEGLMRDRPLKVVLFDLDQIPPDGGPPSWPGIVLLERAQISAPPVTFRHFEFGCVGSKVLVTAWAPASTAAPVDPEGWRAPRPGDYFASTGWVDKSGCGLRGTQHFQLALTPVE